MRVKLLPEQPRTLRQVSQIKLVAHSKSSSVEVGPAPDLVMPGPWTKEVAVAVVIIAIAKALAMTITM